MIAFVIKHWPYAIAALTVVVVGVKAWWSKWNLQRALQETRWSADRERARADQAEDTAAAATEAIERRDIGAATEHEVIDAGHSATAAHPEDPDAAGTAADDYARRRHAELRAHRDATGGDPPPVPGSAAAGATAPRRGR